MSAEDRKRWDEKWAQAAVPGDVNGLLQANRGRLQGSIALDIACGLGQNAIWLAEQGYQVLAVDISYIALQQARERANMSSLTKRITFAQADLDVWRPGPCSVDVVCVFRFLDRRLFAYLERALKPGGLLFYQTRHEGVLRCQPGANRTYLLNHGELAATFPSLTVLDYREDEQDASLVASKPTAVVSRETKPG